MILHNDRISPRWFAPMKLGIDKCCNIFSPHFERLSTGSGNARSPAARAHQSKTNLEGVLHYLVQRLFMIYPLVCFNIDKNQIEIVLIAAQVIFSLFASVTVMKFLLKAINCFNDFALSIP